MWSGIKWKWTDRQKRRLSNGAEILQLRKERLMRLWTLAKKDKITFSHSKKTSVEERVYVWRLHYGKWSGSHVDWYVYVTNRGYRFEIADSGLGTLVTYENDLVERNEKSEVPNGEDITVLVDYVQRYFSDHFNSWEIDNLRSLMNQDTPLSEQGAVSITKSITDVIPSADSVEPIEEGEMPLLSARIERLKEKNRSVEGRTKHLYEALAGNQKKGSVTNSVTDSMSSDKQPLPPKKRYLSPLSEHMKRIQEVNRLIEIHRKQLVDLGDFQLEKQAKFLALKADYYANKTAKQKGILKEESPLLKGDAELLSARLNEEKSRTKKPGFLPIASRDSAVSFEPYTEPTLLLNKEKERSMPLGNPAITSLDEEVSRSIARTKELLTETDIHGLFAIEQQHRLDTLCRDHREVMACYCNSGEHPTETLLDNVHAGLSLLLQKINELNDPLVRSKERDAERLVHLIQQR